MLVMPSRVETLKDDISRSQRRHQAILKTLFNTTLSTLELNNVQQPQHHDLAWFLEANNISADRYFNSSTLPLTDSLQSSKYINAPRTVPYHRQVEPNGDFTLSSSEDSGLLRAGGIAPGGLGEEGGEVNAAPAHLTDNGSSPWLSNGISASEPTAERLPLAGGQDQVFSKGQASNADVADLIANQGVPQEPHLRPSEALPSSSEDVGSVVPAASKEPVAGQGSGNSRNAPQPLKDVRDGVSKRLVQSSDEGEGDRNQGKVLSQADPSDLEPPAVEVNADHRADEEDGQGFVAEPRPDDTLKSQIERAPTDAFGGTASTPDEQLRLEEAQSTHLPTPTKGGNEEELESMPPPPSLSSAFVHDDAVGEVTIPDVSDVDNDVSLDQSYGTHDNQNKQIDLLARRTDGLRDYMPVGMHRDSSRDLTLSRRPPMRIDTGTFSISDSTQVTGNASNGLPIPMSSGTATPSKTAPSVGNVQSPPERMTTRVASGALRHKSVSEILGETPKATQVQADKGNFTREPADYHREDQHPLQTPKSASGFSSPDPIAFKQRLNELKEKERSKLSTVVFASSRNADVSQGQQLGEDETPKEDKDYLLTLFNFQVASPPRAHTLNALVKSAHKTLTTADHFTDFNERQACRVLNKIYELQARNCWSLRQFERSAEPVRPVSHQDVLLSEMKWMRTDFREERKWKMAAAKFTADACAIWVAGSPEERQYLQVKVRSEPAKESLNPDSASTPGLVHSPDGESSEASDDDCIRDPGSAPAAIFSLPPEMFVFGVNQSPVAEKLLAELPLYQPHAEIQSAALRASDFDLDGIWKKALVPVSKYAQGKIVSTSSFSNNLSLEEGPPRKRGRFNYYEADRRRPGVSTNNEDGNDKILEPEQEDVALFDPEHKHIRDRIHTGHAFRPPSEYIMPTQSFFESRQPSQWAQAEDDELRRIVKEYSYNWSLISSSMTLPSMFSSGPERRTPWECFERWISLEGLPVEMAKINYFRAYHSRLQAAQKNVEAHQLAQQQQQGVNAAQLPPRKRSTQPYSVERRKEQRHLHLVDAMRKLAKKRENALNKQQHIAGITAMRKAQEGPKTRREMHTPQEFSRLKYNQQLKMEENARQYRAQVIQNQRANQAAKANQQAGLQPNGMQPVRNSIPGPPNGSSLNVNGVNIPDQLRGGGADPSRPAPSMQRIATGQTNGVVPTNAHSVPHAPMQSSSQLPMQMQQRAAPGAGPDTRVMQEASRVQAQQQAYQQQIRQQGHPQPNGHAGSPNMQHPSLLSHNNTALLGTSLQGRSSPSINGVPPPAGISTSPHMGQPQALSSGMTPAVNHISAQIKTRHPQASPEQITRMTTDQLYKMSTQHAMQAAAGNANLNAVNSNSNIGPQAPSPMQHAAMMASGGSPILNPAHYAQIMRTQQASQQRGVNAGGGQGTNGNNNTGNGMNGSRSVTPLIQRTASGQGGPRPSQSPSARPVGLAK